MNRFLLCIFIYPTVFIAKSYAQASFTAPDTICVNSPVTIQNTSVGASTYFWNFCSGGLYGTPDLTNLGNVGNAQNLSTFMVTAKDGNNYYGFITNNGTASLLRLDFGTNLLNTPTVTNMGSFGGTIPINTEGLQVVKDVDGWHVIIVGGATVAAAAIMKLDFGASLSNNSPVATNWGNIGGLNYPVDLYLFQDGGNWYGLTVNFYNNTVTRFAFGPNFRNPPVGTNLGGVGGVNMPTGISAIQENGKWYVFVANEVDNSVSRLDFGNSLTNTPTGVKLTNPALSGPRDLCVIHDCGGIFALVVNNFSNELVRLDFNSDITSNPTAVSLGNGGNLSFPHSISTIFREGNNLYAFITNINNNTITRLVFKSCTSSSIGSSTQAVVPAVSYNTAGIYTVNLLTNESLPNQTTYCKNIVVMPVLAVDLGNDKEICGGTTLMLDAGSPGNRYLWNTGATTQTISVTTSGTYSVTVTNGGCSATDMIKVTVSAPMSLNTPVVTNADCGILYGKIEVHPTGGTRPYTYYVNGTNRNSDSVYSQLTPGNYTVRVVDAKGCEVSMPLTITGKDIMGATGNGISPTCYGVTDGTITIQVQSGAPPFEYAIAGQAYQSGASFTGLGSGTYKVYARNAVCIDSVEVTLTAPAVLIANVTTDDETCERGNGKATVNVTGGTIPYNIYWDNVLQNTNVVTGLSKGNYTLSVTDVNSCNTGSTIDINNINPPPVHITNHDTTVNIGDIVALHAVNAVDYQWTPAEGLSCTDCPSPFAQPLTPTTYIVQTVTGLNCVPADTVTINLTYNRSLYAPNAFSPNGDGVNDVFRVKGKGVAYYSMTIYNRWGGFVYQTSDMNKGWDGVLQEVGGYVYVIEYAFYGKESTRLKQKGTVALVR
ncbi:gliding motility-associated C-terminal domain-containing protein [Chitinophaga sp. YR573]|uniref:T9SS type B sorting domain-containing protein n=1 Tax=Chitinophaga sp. YR573 TaxID=1881040 RepID=UPI0008B2E974|nr:gliding motility-associated C-terminal domain-containing protein [Chitinophaga sp. YR573]SEW44676.1 gliding motility-associated C-terminal domain-containing protein [Chitinophaga sp. YR573]